MKFMNTRYIQFCAVYVHLILKLTLTVCIYKNLIWYKIMNMESMVETEHNTWIEITDDMIKNVGFKSKSGKGNERTNLFTFIKKKL